MSSVLITGASGFVGSAVVERLANHAEFTPRAAMRRQKNHFISDIDFVQVGDLAPNTDWSSALQSVVAVVHAAARVHVMRDTAIDSLSEFHLVNVEGTLALAQQAAEVGVKRFIFISSIKVNGEETKFDHPYTENQPPLPEDPYGISKRDAEDKLKHLARETGMEIVIIRPPLVYGPGVKGNFQKLIYWVDKGLPLPLGSIANKRSLVALDNLVDLIITCLEHPAAANQTFLAGDGEDLSTTELLQRVALAMGKPSRLIPVPMIVSQGAAALLGKKAMMQRLCGSLQVDISKARNMLGWNPPVTVDEGLRRAVAGIV